MCACDVYFYNPLSLWLWKLLEELCFGSARERFATVLSSWKVYLGFWFQRVWELCSFEKEYPNQSGMQIMKSFEGKRDPSCDLDLGCCSLFFFWWTLWIFLVMFCSVIVSNCGEVGRYFWDEMLFLILASLFLGLELFHFMFHLIWFCWLVFLDLKRNMFFHLALKFTPELRLSQCW